MKSAREVWAPVLDYFCNACNTYWHDRSPANVETFTWELVGESQPQLPTRHRFLLIAKGPGYGDEALMVVHAIDVSQIVIVKGDGGSLAFVNVDYSGPTFSPGHFFDLPFFASVTAMALYAREAKARG